MRRPFLSFLLAVILPAAAAMELARRGTEEAWGDVVRESHALVARMTLAATAEEVRSDREGGPPRAPVTVGRSTGYRTSLYRDGTRWTGTEPPPGPERLPAEVAARVGPGTPVEAGETADAGVFLARSASGTPPALVALAAPRDAAAPLVAAPVLLVMGLLLLFGALTGWIQLARRDLRRERLALGGVVGPALVPALATLVFFVHLDRSFQQAAYRAQARDLGRGLAVAAAVGSVDDPHAVRSLTGFHATRVRSGAAEVSSLGGELGTLAALRAPPSSFTSSGAVTTIEGPSTYVALRLEGRTFLVATAPLPETRVAALRKRLFWIGAALAGWWMLAAAGAWAGSWSRGRRESPGPEVSG